MAVSVIPRRQGERRLLLALALLLAFALGAPAHAAETGTLRGNVIDNETSEPLAGVLITLTGPSLPGARTKTTDVRGTLWFPVLPPGDYQVNFSLEGYQTLEIPATVELDNQPFDVTGATLDPNEHGWAGHTSYQDLAAPYLLGGESPPRWVSLEFVSPTTFSSQGRSVPLPLPESPPLSSLAASRLPSAS